MPTLPDPPPAPANGGRDLSRTYALAIVVEAFVIGALYWLGAHFA